MTTFFLRCFSFNLRETLRAFQVSRKIVHPSVLLWYGQRAEDRTGGGETSTRLAPSLLFFLLTRQRNMSISNSIQQSTTEDLYHPCGEVVDLAIQLPEEREFGSIREEVGRVDEGLRAKKKSERGQSTSSNRRRGRWELT